MQVGDILDETAPVGNGIEGIQVFLQRGESLGVQPGGIKSLLVKVDYLLLDGPGFGLHRCHLLEEIVDILDVVLGKLVECTETGVLGFKRVLDLPSVCGVHVEILSGSHGSIQIRQVKGGHFRLFLPACGQCYGNSHDHIDFFHFTYVI